MKRILPFLVMLLAGCSSNGDAVLITAFERGAAKLEPYRTSEGDIALGVPLQFRRLAGKSLAAIKADYERKQSAEYPSEIREVWYDAQSGSLLLLSFPGYALLPDPEAKAAAIASAFRANMGHDRVWRRVSVLDGTTVISVAVNHGGMYIYKLLFARAGARSFELVFLIPEHLFALRRADIAAVAHEARYLK